MTALGREIVRRRPWPGELLLLAWSALCIANAMQALRCRNLGIVYTPPIFLRHGFEVGLWALLALTVTVAGFYGLARQRRWRAIVVCGAVVIVAGIVSGALQLGSCPHATYLQVVGLDIPIVGNACGNSQNQNLQPWWLR